MDYCNCYREDKRCNGTKEIDHCSCGGDKSMCDFYDYVRDGIQKNINKCRYNSNDGQDICCNSDCPYCEDFCPVSDYPEVCVFRGQLGDNTKKSVIEKEFHFDKWIRFDNFCPKCNQMLQQKFNYCPNCGQKLDFNNPVKIIVKDD